MRVAEGTKFEGVRRVAARVASTSVTTAPPHSRTGGRVARPSLTPGGLDGPSASGPPFAESEVLSRHVAREVLVDWIHRSIHPTHFFTLTSGLDVADDRRGWGVAWWIERERWAHRVTQSAFQVAIPYLSKIEYHEDGQLHAHGVVCFPYVDRQLRPVDYLPRRVVAQSLRTLRRTGRRALARGLLERVKAEHYIPWFWRVVCQVLLSGWVDLQRIRNESAMVVAYVTKYVLKAGGVEAGLLVLPDELEALAPLSELKGVFDGLALRALGTGEGRERAGRDRARARDRGLRK